MKSFHFILRKGFLAIVVFVLISIHCQPRIPEECWQYIQCPGIDEGDSTPLDKAISLLSVPFPWASKLHTYPSAFIFVKNEEAGDIGDIRVIREGDKQLPSIVTGFDRSGNEVRMQLSFRETSDTLILGEAVFSYRGEVEAIIVEELREDKVLVSINYIPQPAFNVKMLIFRPADQQTPAFPVQIQVLNQSFSGNVVIGEPDIPHVLEEYNEFLKTQGREMIMEIGGPGRITALDPDFLDRIICCDPEEQMWCLTKSIVQEIGGCDLIDWLNYYGHKQISWRSCASVLAGGLADTWGPLLTLGVGMVNAFLLENQ